MKHLLVSTHWVWLPWRCVCSFSELRNVSVAMFGMSQTVCVAFPQTIASNYFSHPSHIYHLKGNCIWPQIAHWSINACSLLSIHTPIPLHSKKSILFWCGRNITTDCFPHANRAWAKLQHAVSAVCILQRRIKPRWKRNELNLKLMKGKGRWMAEPESGPLRVLCEGIEIALSPATKQI